MQSVRKEIVDVVYLCSLSGIMSTFFKRYPLMNRNKNQKDVVTMDFILSITNMVKGKRKKQ